MVPTSSVRRLSMAGLGLLLGSLAAPSPATPSPQRQALRPPSIEPVGTWDNLGPPNLFRHTAVYDSRRRRMILLGGRADNGEINPPNNRYVWSLKLDSEYAWDRIPAGGIPPGANDQFAAVYDPASDRILVFGGADLSTRYNDVWSLSLGDSTANWARLPVRGIPPTARAGAAACYDPAGKRVIVFGGEDTAAKSDLWELDLTLPDSPAWAQLMAPGTAPMPRRGAGLVLARGVMILFGGKNGSVSLDDAYRLDLAGEPAWRKISAVGPSPGGRLGTGAAYDAWSGSLWVFGGGTGLDIRNQDLWRLSLGDTATWERVRFTGPPSYSEGHRDHSVLFDPVRRTFLVHGGSDGGKSLVPILSYDGATWALNLTELQWKRLGPGGFAGDSRCVYDRKRDRAICLLGGNQVWTVLLADFSWTQQIPIGRWPVGLTDPAMIYDPEVERLVVLGGRASDKPCELWTFSMSGANVSRWTQLEDSAPPSFRYAHSAIYDPVNRRAVFFGGIGNSGRAGWHYFNEAWSFDLAGSKGWTRIAGGKTTDFPVGRFGQAAMLDSRRNRMLIFGGEDSVRGPWCWGSAGLNDVWAMSLFPGHEHWSQLAQDADPSFQTPGRRRCPFAAFDSSADRMLLFGGMDPCPQFPDYLGDSWMWQNGRVSGFQALTTIGDRPSSRFGQTCVLDQLRNRLVVFGGAQWDGVAVEDIRGLSLNTIEPGPRFLDFQVWPADVGIRAHWEYTADPHLQGFDLERAEVDSLGMPGNWVMASSHLIPPGTRTFLDLPRPGRYVYRVIGIRGEEASVPSGEVKLNTSRAPWDLLSLDAPSLILDQQPLRLSFHLPSSAWSSTARLDIYDVSGRRIANLLDGRPGPGVHDLAWSRLDSSGLRVASGVYFARLVAGGDHLIRRIVVLR